MIILHLLPALRVGGVEIMCVAERHGRTAAAETQQFTFGAFLKAFMLAVLVHLRSVIYIIHIFRCRTDITLETAARHEPAVGRDCEMAVTAVATVIDGIGV